MQQKQEIVLNFLKDAFSQELRDGQVKELRQILVSDRSPFEKKKNIIEKIKSFGSDVAANIIANIIANPSTYQLFV